MENANEAIYIGVYTMIFVIALSLTIFLFSNMMSYSERAYDYLHAVGDNSITESTIVNRNLIISGQEVISYYFNYVKKDRFDSATYNSNTIVKIYLNKYEPDGSGGIENDWSYEKLLQNINLEDSYILSVDTSTTKDVTIINICKATPEQLEQYW